MKEKEILKLALTELGEQGKICWVAIKRKGFDQQDIFGIFDIIYLEHAKFLKGAYAATTVTGFIQCTTKHHISDRRKKILAFFREKAIPIPSRVFIWAYDSKKCRFEKEIIE